MKIPNGMTEADVLESINKVANRLASKFQFGYHDIEDMKQQVCLEILTPDKNGLTILDKYDSDKGASLDTFLWIYVHNRLHNFKRNNYERPKPCLDCPLNAYNINCESQCELYTDKMECDLYRNWYQRNVPKRNLMDAIGIDNVQTYNETFMTQKDVSEIIDTKHIMEIIDQNIPIELRSDWVKLQNDIKIPRSKKQKLIETIHSILSEANINVEETW